MKKLLLFFLCITTLSYAMEPATPTEYEKACTVILYAAMRETAIREDATRATNKPIHLVVGSDRCSAILHGRTKDKLLAELYCEKKADLTHTKHMAARQ